MNFSHIYYPHEEGISLTTATSIPVDTTYYTLASVLPYEEHEPIRYFNCKRCGAVGQYGKCEYCGSAEEGEPNDNS